MKRGDVFCILLILLFSVLVLGVLRPPEYTAMPSAQMPRLEEIEKSLGESLKKLLTQGDNAARRRRGDAIEKDLKEARRVNGNNKTKAQAMMRVVRGHLPVILNEGFEKEMRLRGITLR